MRFARSNSNENLTCQPAVTTNKHPKLDFRCNASPKIAPLKKVSIEAESASVIPQLHNFSSLKEEQKTLKVFLSVKDFPNWFHSVDLMG